MTPIRALFFLAAITAACAARIPAQADDIHSLKTQLALLSHQRLAGSLVGSPIDNAIEKFEELVRKIKERVHQLENVLIDALQGSSVAVAKAINQLILKRTGIDLNLPEKLEGFEKKAEECNAAFETDLKTVLLEIKTETETCAADQVEKAKDLLAKARALIDILTVVPAKTIKDIKACGQAPVPTEAPTTPESTETPATDSPAIPDSTDEPIVRGRHSVRSWSDAWDKAKCVTKALAKGAQELSDVPDLVVELVSDEADLYNKESRKALEKCAQQSVAGKGTRVQLAAAQLAYCVIAPSQQ